jgi:large conductance mechanosensitive channel
MLEGFKKFVLRGNVIDLAVGVIIGAAFGAIVDSLVKDILTPIIGLFGGQPDFAAIKMGGIAVGSFLNAVFSFILKAFALYGFIVVPYNRLTAKPAPPAAPPKPSGTETLLAEIRDLLRVSGR